MAEEEDEHDDHEHRALDEISAHRRDRAVDELRAIVEGHELDALGQRAFDVVDTRPHALDDGSRVLSNEHDGDPGDYFAIALRGHRALAECAARDNLPEIAHVHGSTVLPRLDDDAPEIVGRRRKSDRPQDVLLGTVLDVASADVRVIPGD